jgi:MmyB-like transcription regulator ligand binding domain
VERDVQQRLTPSSAARPLVALLEANEGALRLFACCGVRLPGDGPLNALRVLFDGALGFRECLVNFDEVADEVLARLRTEADADPSLRDLAADLERMRGKRAPRGGPNAVGLPIHLGRGTTDLRYFTTLTTLGTPLDVTAQEPRIEGNVPLDAETDAFARRLAGEA